MEEEIRLEDLKNLCYQRYVVGGAQRNLSDFRTDRQSFIFINLCWASNPSNVMCSAADHRHIVQPSLSMAPQRQYSPLGPALA
jgi:hypothetical protein